MVQKVLGYIHVHVHHGGIDNGEGVCTVNVYKHSKQHEKSGVKLIKIIDGHPCCVGQLVRYRAGANWTNQLHPSKSLCFSKSDLRDTIMRSQTSPDTLNRICHYVNHIQK